MGFRVNAHESYIDKMMREERPRWLVTPMIQTLAKDRELIVVFDRRIRRGPAICINGAKQLWSGRPGLLCFQASAQKKRPPRD